MSIEIFGSHDVPAEHSAPMTSLVEERAKWFNEAKKLQTELREAEIARMTEMLNEQQSHLGDVRADNLQLTKRIPELEQDVNALHLYEGRALVAEAKLCLTEGAFKNTRIRDLEAEVQDTQCSICADRIIQLQAECERLRVQLSEAQAVIVQLHSEVGKYRDAQQ